MPTLTECMMIQGSADQEAITVQHACASKNQASKYTRQKLKEPKGSREIHN